MAVTSKTTENIVNVYLGNDKSVMLAIVNSLLVWYENITYINIVPTLFNSWVTCMKILNVVNWLIAVAYPKV